IDPGIQEAGLIEYKGGLHVHSSLVNVVLSDQVVTQAPRGPHPSLGVRTRWSFRFTTNTRSRDCVCVTARDACRLWIVVRFRPACFRAGFARSIAPGVTACFSSLSLALRTCPRRDPPGGGQ